MNRASSQEPTGLKWTRRTAASLLALVAFAGFGVSAGLLYGHGEIDRRVARLGDELGISVSVNHVDLGFGRPTTVHQIAITVPGGPRVAVGSALANLDLLALISGERRPSEATVRGLRMALTVHRGGVVGLDAVLAAWRKRQSSRPEAAAAKGTPKPLTLTLEDARIHVTVADKALPPMSLVVDDVAAVLSKKGARVELEASGSIDFAGAKRRGTIRAALEGERVVRASLELSRQIWLPVEVRGRRLLVAATGFERRSDTGETILLDVGVRDGIHTASASRVVLTDRKGTPSLDGVPRPRDIVRAVVEDGSVARDGDTASAKTVSLALGWVEGETLPRVRSVSFAGARMASPSRGLVASVESASVRLRDVASKTLAQPEHLAAALAAVTLTTPTATIIAPKGQLAAILPKRLRKYLPGAKPAAAGSLPRPSLSAAAGGRAKRLVKLMRALPMTISDGLVEFKERGVGDLMTLDNMALRLAPGEDDSLGIEVDAMIVRAGQPTGQVRLKTTIDKNGRPLQARGLVAGQDVAHLVSKFSKYVSVPPEADIEVAFNWSPPSATEKLHKLTGTAKLNNFGFEAWRVSHVPISGVKGEVQYTVTYDPERKHIALHLPKIRLSEATMNARLDVTLPQQKSKLKFAARLAMPKQDCAAVRRSIPNALMPRLAGLKVRGSMWFDARIDVDMDQPKKLKLDVLGSMESCAVLTLGEIDVAKLKRTFVHHPVEPKEGVRKDISVGPGTSQWVSSRSLPKFVKAAAIVTEDRGYWRHRGVRFVLVRRALKLNLKHGRFVYGGSTITQQLVKNIYLSREKTMGRKLEEAIIAMQMERVLTKDEILTLYVNVVEFGPSIYGVKKASRIYFGKHPRDLAPLEAAFIMGLKPWPRGGYKQWTLGRVNAYWVKRLHHILDMMQRREASISAEEVEAAAPYQPKFRPQGASTSWGTPYERPE